MQGVQGHFGRLSINRKANDGLHPVYDENLGLGSTFDDIYRVETGEQILHHQVEYISQQGLCGNLYMQDATRRAPLRLAGSHQQQQNSGSSILQGSRLVSMSQQHVLNCGNHLQGVDTICQTVANTRAMTWMCSLLFVCIFFPVLHA